MEQQLRRCFAGALGFAFVVTWATLGATTAVVAAIVCLAGANAHRLLPAIDGAQLPSKRRRRPAISARPLRTEHDRARRLVPDEPSLVISTQP